MTREGPDTLRQMRRTLRSEGMVVQPVKTRAPYVKGYGFTPEVVFDVGVGSGTPWLYRSFPDARFVLIDPQESCASIVREKGVRTEFHFHAVAAGAQEGQADLIVPWSDKGCEIEMASLLKRTDKLSKNFVRTDKHPVQVRPLDQIARGYPGPAGLKVDTEGYDIEVLRGAPETLARCEFVIMELSLSHRFDGITAPSDAVALLKDAGLELRDVLSIASGPGKRARPRYMNVLFTRWAQ